MATTYNPIRWLSESVSNRLYKYVTRWTGRRRYDIVTEVTQTVDSSTINYLEMRAIAKGCVITVNGSKYGSNYVFASAFAAPIINSTTAIMLANPPMVTLKNKTSKESEQFSASMSEWYSKNQSTIYSAIVDSQSEGDAYILIKNDFDAKAVRLLPENVQKIVNQDDYTDTIGYEVRQVQNEYDVKGDVVTNTYKVIYRKTFPYVIKIHEFTNENSVNKIVAIDGEPTDIATVNNNYVQTVADHDDYAAIFNIASAEGERELPIIHFYYKISPQSTNGDSVFTNLLNYFLQYHRVLDATLRNVTFNLLSLPYIKGVDNVSSFLRENGELDTDTGTYKIKLEPGNMLIGGSDFEINMLNAPDTVGSAGDVLKKLFYLIVQASQVPEFFFGTAVKSSMASVKEQMPIVINKAQQYQNNYAEQMIELFTSVSFYKQLNGDVTIPETHDINFNWGAVILDDVDNLIKIADALDSAGLVTKKTKAYILGLSKFTNDIAQEIDDAANEAETETKDADSKLIGDSVETNLVDNELNVEAEVVDNVA